jgi:type II secretory pathway component GspD/PulD (secretin)
MKAFRKRYWYEVALCASFIQFIHSPIAYTAEMEEGPVMASSSPKVDVDIDTYTAKFNNVSMTELIRFASKITNLNFIFEETDLQFPVTVMSEEAVSAKNIMAAISQVLRTHNLILLEQDGNVLITKSTKVNQIPPIVSSDLSDPKAGNAALVTRIFRIKNANINTIANIIRPMTSEGALIEISSETRQLIVTDITPNTEQIAALLTSLDAPHTPLDIEIYTVKHVHAPDLITITKQILTPFTEGNPLIFVPQTDTNAIYIVSTPHLIERAMTIMEDLDIPSKPVVGRPLTAGKSIFIYKALHRSPSQLLSELRRVGDRLKAAGGIRAPLEVAIEDAQEIPDNESLLFLVDPDTMTQLKEILASLDTPLGISPDQVHLWGKSTFLVYNPVFRSDDELKDELHNLTSSLKTSGLSDTSLLDTLQTMKWIPENNSLVFTGDPQSIEKVRAILKTLDIAQAHASKSSQIFIYKLQHAHCMAVIEELRNIGNKMSPTSLQNQSIIDAIKKIECLPSNNALLLTGSTEVLEQIKTMIGDFDTPNGTSSPATAQAFLIYKPKYLPAVNIETALNVLASHLQATDLKDPQLFQALSTMRYVPETNSLLFAGSQQGLDKVQELLTGIDTPAALSAIQSQGAENITFLLYKVQSTTAEKLVTSLRTVAVNLQQSNMEDKQIAHAIETVKVITETNSLLFTGTSATLAQIEQLLQKFDVPGLGTSVRVERAAHNFVIYKPKYVSGEELISILRDFMQNLMLSGISDPPLFETIETLKWIEKTSSLLISGDKSAIATVEQLLAKFDIPGKENIAPSIESIDNVSFLVYKLQFHPGNDIQSALKQVATSLGKGENNTAPSALYEAVNSIQWIQVTNSLLCSGHQDVLVKLKDLIQNLDIPLKQVFIEVLVINTTLANQQNFGLMWGGQVQYFNKTILQTGNFPIPPPNTTTPATTFPSTLNSINATNTPRGGLIPFSSGFDLGVIGDIIMHKGRSFISLGSLLNALQQDTDSTVLLNPKIVTQDNRQSTIFVGQNVPYTGSLVTNSQTAGTIQTANIEYRDVGVSLTITPILGDGDVITMDIVNDISQIIGNQNVTTNNQQVTGIQTTHTHMETRVHVPDNHFVALSGMINDSKTHFKTSIPCLGGLPVIGAAFSENDRTANKSNILIFVRPQIIKSYREYKAITEHQEWLYKDNVRLPSLKEEFDEGIDMVKLPENE